MGLQFESILFEKDGAVAWITLNRPERHNAIDPDTAEELLQALLAAQDDQEIGSIVITGAGRSFSVGEDPGRLSRMKAGGEGFEHLLPFIDQGRRIVSLLHDCPKPIVAMVNGLAASAGCNLALACDLRVAGEHAAFQQSFIQAGLHPDWGGSYFLPRLIGQGRALEMMLTGKRIEAEEAQEIGLVHQVVAHSHLREHTSRLAHRLAKAPRTAARYIKLATNNSLDNDLQSMLEFETEAQRQCWASAESTEAFHALDSVRPHRFPGEGLSSADRV